MPSQFETHASDLLPSVGKFWTTYYDLMLKLQREQGRGSTEPVKNRNLGTTGVSHVSIFEQFWRVQLASALRVVTLARLGDSEAEVSGSDFTERWRRYLAAVNLYQFCDTFQFWSSSEVDTGLAPDLPLAAAAAVAEEWQNVMDNSTQALRTYVAELASAGLPLPAGLPAVEHYNDDIDDDAFAELAWPTAKPPVAVLAGDQINFVSQWQKLGWKVVVPDDLQAKGIGFLIELITKGI